MKKRILSILLTLCMVLSLMPAAAFGDGASPDITGTGAEDDPYLIYTAEGLKQFRDAVNGGHGGAHARLMADIVLNDGTFDENGNWSKSGTPDRWMPIGNSYCGTFDGNGYTIRGLYVKDAGYAGLFGNVYQGAVKNVTVTGYVEGTQYAGGIAGHVNKATVSGCTNAATVKGGSSNVGGIVGYFFSAGNVRNCANLGSVWAQLDSDQGMANVGGIAGRLGDRDITIADCYNAGSITIEDSGTGEYEVSYLGGIVGSTLMSMEPSYISNCYSAGPLTYRGSASAVIRGIAGDVIRCVITNCYWLEGTAESGVGGSPLEASADAKTKADFADGTVLALLKGDRTDSPWADECQYVAAAGMTLPVFKGRTGDAHTCTYQWQNNDTEHWKQCACGRMEADSTAAHSPEIGNCTDGISCICGYKMIAATNGHDWTAWQHQTTSHTRSCQNPHCGITESSSCTGGTATCTEQALCDVCGQPYGPLDPDNHMGQLEWTQTAATHRQEWSCCHAETVAEEPHEWENGVCTECGYGCAHQYQWRSDSGAYWQRCDLCGRETARQAVPQLTLTGPDTVCRTQDYTFTFTLPQELTDAVYGYEFTYLGDGPLTPTLDNGVYTGVVKAAGYPRDENGFKVVVYAQTADGFTVTAEKTVTIQNTHTGGTATCTEQALCDVCGQPYGPLDPDKHMGGVQQVGAKAPTCTQDGYTGDEVCTVCKEIIKKGEVIPATGHDYKDGKCAGCGATDPNYKPAEPVQPENPGVKTGDEAHTALWLAAASVSLLAAALLLGKKKHLN